MTPNDDRKLVQFLRQHRPTVPPATANLEDRIMAALETTAWEPSPIAPQPRSRSAYWSQWGQRWGMAGLILTISLLAAWMGQRAWRLAQTPSPAEMAEIEQFMAQSWQGVVVSSTADVYNPFFVEAGVEARADGIPEASPVASIAGEF